MRNPVSSKARLGRGLVDKSNLLLALIFWCVASQDLQIRYAPSSLVVMSMGMYV